MPCCTTDTQTQIPYPISLNTTGPSKCKLVNKLHLASIACPLPALAKPGRPGGVQVVWNCPTVADRYNWQFSQDTLYWYDMLLCSTLACTHGCRHRLLAGGFSCSTKLATIMISCWLTSSPSPSQQCRVCQILLPNRHVKDLGFKMGCQ